MAEHEERTGASSCDEKVVSERPWNAWPIPDYDEREVGKAVAKAIMGTQRDAWPFKPGRIPEQDPV